MDTLYTLLRSADNRHTPPLQPVEARKVIALKQAFFAAEMAANPLAREIFFGGRITYAGLAAADRSGFLAGPATFFRTHEILRKTRSADAPITIGGAEFSHDDAVALFARCIPNVKLRHVPWCAPERYLMSLALAWGITLLVAHIVARENEGAGLWDSAVLFYLGTAATVAALMYSALKQNRDVRHSAPWNSALYLDLNVDLLRRRSPALAWARKELLPRQKPWKTSAFYYALARRLEAFGFDAELARRMPALETDAAAVRPGGQTTAPGEPDRGPVATAPRR